MARVARTAVLGGLASAAPGAALGSLAEDAASRISRMMKLVKDIAHCIAMSQRECAYSEELEACFGRLEQLPCVHKGLAAAAPGSLGLTIGKRCMLRHEIYRGNSCVGLDGGLYCHGIR